MLHTLDKALHRQSLLSALEKTPWDIHNAEYSEHLSNIKTETSPETHPLILQRKFWLKEVK